MWDVDNHTPFADGHAWVRDREGAEVWLVAIRGTFSILPDGEVAVAKQQQEVCMAPQHRGDPGHSSLLYDTDVPPLKHNTDIIIHGHAYSPHGEPARELAVSISVGPVKKTLKVYGDRTWDTGLLGGSRLSTPESFFRMPIIYERAFGGYDTSSATPSWDERNPVGRGFVDDARHLIGKKAPNIEYPALPIGSWASRSSPAGFGPICANWSSRRRWAGTYDQTWLEQRHPLLPYDFDDRFYQCAPEDQQTTLVGGEAVRLHYLTPDGALKFRLPRVRLLAETNFSNGRTNAHSFSLHTAIIEPDELRLSLVWHSYLPCHQDVLRLESTKIEMNQLL